MTVEVADDGLWASGAGLRFRPLAALDTTDRPDETLAVEPPRVEGDTVVVERRSTVWEHARTELVRRGDAVEVRTFVRGRGALADAHLLGGRSLIPGKPLGLLPSAAPFETVFTPSPSDPARTFRPATEPAVIGVSGDSEPGRAHGFFTPAPLFLVLGDVGLGVAAPVERLTFVELEYAPIERAFSIRLAYEGHTRVDGEFEAPALVLRPGVRDPYDGIAAHRDDLVARGLAPAPRDRERPAWWSEPIFCGWGAQCAAASGRPARDLATQERYDEFLAELDRHGVSPGTIVLDDKWQAAYGTNEPDTAKWPDLPGWIERRRAQGRRVLLWWKAWDPEGLAPELCIRNPDGTPVAVDPTNPAARDELRRIVARMVSVADGLKIDFSARTPRGSALTAHGDGWGIALLHDLLALVHDAAKEANPDALLITQTPHASFADVTDMIRLNDMVPVGTVEDMRHRAAVARAACPDLLVDTDDWSVPSLDVWREYQKIKGTLGVPALYYATRLDSGEELEPRDYALLREEWAGWRERQARRAS